MNRCDACGKFRAWGDLYEDDDGARLDELGNYLIREYFICGNCQESRVPHS